MRARTEPGDDQVTRALKIFKNAFAKEYVIPGKGLSSQEMSGILLLIACQCLIEKASINILDKIGAPKQATASILTDSDWLALMSRLYDILSCFCPVEAKQALPPPDINSVKTARKLLPEECWRLLGSEVSSIGFTYEIVGLAARKQALRATQTANKVLALDQLIAFTQLYTPDWVVDFLIGNTLLPLLQDVQVGSNAERHGQWLLKGAPGQAGGSVARSNLATIKLIDPACGSGQFLLSAFDLFCGSYKASGIDSAQATQTVLANNLYGADIDIQAIWVASLGLLVKSLLAGGNGEVRLKNLHCSITKSDPTAGDLLGSISRNWLNQPNHILSKTYDVVVTNPPYIGRKSLSRDLKFVLKRDYPRCAADICAAFLERSMEMLSPGGRMGIITQSSFLTLPSYKSLRQYLLARYRVDSVIKCGTGVFPLASGEKIDNVLIVAEAPAKAEADFDLPLPADDSDFAAKARFCITLDQRKDKSRQLTSAIATGKQSGSVSRSTNHSDSASGILTRTLMRLVSEVPPLQSIAEVKQGLATTNNHRFVRFYWDVPQEDLGTVWKPYVKGAGSERWYSENNFVVKWGNDGGEIKQAVIDAYPYLKGKSSWVVKNEQFYFRPGLCFSFINKNHLAVRRLPAGCIFDVASSAIFSKNGDEDFLFAYLNSFPLSAIANTINPTINLQVGDVKRLPILHLSDDTKKTLSQLAHLCFERKRELESLSSNCLFPSTDNGHKSVDDWLFSSFIRLKSTQAKLRAELEEAQEKIDELVSNAFSKFGHLSAQDLKELRRQNNDRTAKATYTDDHLCDQHAFAARVLAELASNLMWQNESEKIAILPHALDHSMNETLALRSGAASLLEKMLGMKLAQYFVKSKVVDLNKQAKRPSRYFSVWLPNSRALMFLSTRALRDVIGSSGHADRGFKIVSSNSHAPYDQSSDAQTIAINEATDLIECASMHIADKIDWTSSDLLKAFNNIE